MRHLYIPAESLYGREIQGSLTVPCLGGNWRKDRDCFSDLKFLAVGRGVSLQLNAGKVEGSKDKRLESLGPVLFRSTGQQNLRLSAL